MENLVVYNPRFFSGHLPADPAYFFL
jgi:hypothetical protein